MVRHQAEIAGFTSQASTWLGIGTSVMGKHLDKLRETLQDMERLHQDSYRQHGHLRSPNSSPAAGACWRSWTRNC